MEKRVRVTISTKDLSEYCFIKAEATPDKSCIIQCWVAANSFVEAGGNTISVELSILKKFCEKTGVNYEQTREFVTLLNWANGISTQKEWFTSEFKLAKENPPPPQPVKTILRFNKRVQIKSVVKNIDNPKLDISRKGGLSVRWTEEEDAKLLYLIKTNMHMKDIADALNRSIGSVYQRHAGIIRNKKRRNK